MAPKPTVNPNTINYLNIGLMLVSAAAAFVLPFEVFLFSYAVLGPLHYLTEISWLHDRKYFTKGRFDYWFLLLPAIPLTALRVTPLHTGAMLSGLLLFFAFVCALGMIIFEGALKKIILGFCAFLIAIEFLQLTSFQLIFALFLPTIIHVFIFTGAFILLGSLKSKSASGHLSLAVFAICPAVLLFLPASETYAISAYTQESIRPFDGVISALRDLLYFDQTSGSRSVVMRFIAYAYTYHYLNWFSKTKIIQWHNISRMRFGVICLLYALSLVVYWIDFNLGTIVLFFLSMVHVLLEFPLNHRSFLDIGREFRLRLRA